MPRKRRPKRRTKSRKRQAIGRKLAKQLPRDKKGKFLPKGSKNLFRKTTRTAKKRRRKSVPSKKRKKTRKRSNSAPMGSRGRGIKSRDFFPNFLSGTVVQTSEDVQTTQQIFTPIPRLKTIGNRATVMELLWIDMEEDMIYSLINSELNVTFSIGSAPAPATILRWSDPRVFAIFKQSTEILQVGTAGVGMTVQNDILRYDFQSQDGFGYLLASDSFNVNFRTENTNRVNRIFWKIFYRFVDIPLAEFVGIVQSTQQS